MTVEALQQLLAEDKREEEAVCGYDLCGSYARCDDCDRGEDYPCARAYLRFLRSGKKAPAWKLADPETGWGEPAPAAALPAEAAPIAAEAAPIVAEVAPVEAAAPVEEMTVSAEAPVPAEAEAPISEAPEEQPTEERKKLLRRGTRGGVRLAVFQRKQK